MSLFKFIFIFILALLIQSTSYAICGKTLSQLNPGACSSGGNDWQSALAGAKANMLSVTTNPRSKSLISGVTISEHAQPCRSPSTPICAHGGPIRVRTGIQNPGSYGVTLLHELCHTAGDAPVKNGSGSIQSYYASSLAGSCPQTSPYAACGGGTEEFAEVCTAFLVAPAKLDQCKNASKIKQYIQENLFSGPVSSCAAGGNNGNAGGGNPNGGDPSGGSPSGGLGGLGEAAGGLLQTALQLAPLAFLLSQDDEPIVNPPPTDPKAFCAQNPGSQGCPQAAAIDCTDPKFAKSERECLCDVGINPDARGLPICNETSVAGKVSLNPVGNNAARALGLLNDTSGIANGLSGIGGIVPVKEGDGATTRVLANQAAGGGGGGGPTGGRGLPAKPPRRGGGYGPGPHKTDILGGTSKGGGGYNYNKAGGNYASYGGETENQGVDLSKFLPNKPDRSVAGMSLQAKDGLTGPFGPSIWAKLSKRYQKISPTMKP